MDYARKIKEFRKKNFLSQTDFGKMVGVSYVTVNRWENGHFEPTLQMKKKINDLLISSKK